MCCGRNKPISATPRPQPSVRGTEMFTYVGQTALTVTGPATGTVYRFAAPGARLRVDARDATALRKLPMLRAGD